MKPEDKQLLLKDLSARLPYGVICHYNCVAEYDTMVLQKANCVNKLEGIIPFNGQIGYMVGGDSFDCTTTGEHWEGKFIQRTGEFHKIDPIPMKGFRGFRYFNN